MADFTYTTVPGKIKLLFGKIREVGVPPKVTIQWLKSLGFTSSNDATLIRVLKFVRFIDEGGTPTSKWQQFRGNNHKKILGEAVREGYGDLFKVYPDAYQRPQSDLDHVFTTHSSGGKKTITNTISTFKSLLELAEFTTVEHQPQPDPVQIPNVPNLSVPGRGSVEPTVHIDIQIHISPEASLDQIEQVFASLAKHCYRAA